ncbi:hypothetical protein [Pseudomonas sp.]|uniref:hypothetical protein n=1 Tax=Pseudomonas sp. TaxID=306 RepID=UPI00299EF4E6|nr:hypothetical protein [Pseudomonas sp.]MDX1366898.1 hypothetical protein [Pseudomonas sp.]
MCYPKKFLFCFAMATVLAGCENSSTAPANYPSEDGVYFQTYQETGGPVIEIARVAGGKIVTIKSVLPGGAGLGLAVGMVDVDFNECGRYKLMNATHDSANPTGQQAQRLGLIETRPGGNRDCPLKPMPSVITRVQAKR